MRNFLPVNTKKDFVRRYKDGEFGNASPTWDTLEEFEQSGYDAGPVHIRNRIAGAHTWYDVDPVSVRVTWLNALTLGYKPTDFYISAMAPTPKTIFQGEVVVNPHNFDGHGLCLLYTTVAKPMREALAEKSERASGIMAVSLLKTYLPAKDLDWLYELLARYPGHAVEFSTYSTEWGTVPGFKTLYWEVRNY